MLQINIKFKSLLDGIKNLEERNAYFDYLSDEGKRLEIAWDVIKLILAKQINGSKRMYWDPRLTEYSRVCPDSKELQKFLNTELNRIQNCVVCARGAAMLSQIRLGNCVHPDDEYMSKGDLTNLKGFSMDSFKLMEVEYEGRLIYDWSYGVTVGPFHHNTTEKLLNIFCNVLVNGDFDINDKTNYLNVPCNKPK